MGMRSRRKGKEGEREASKAARVYLNARGAARAAQANGAYSADLIGVHERLHVEVKRIARIPATDFMDQAAGDAREGTIPIVMFREDGGGIDDWILMVRLKDAHEFGKIIESLR